MSAATAIEWTDRTWNPATGCDKVSPGCAGCYAVKDARRLSGNLNPKIAAAAAGTTVRHANGALDWSGVVNLHEDRLLQPLSWRTPARVFVNSMSDLFHEDVPDAFIDKVFAVMALAPQHTFQILTKRPERMLAYFESFKEPSAFDRAVNLCDWANPSYEQIERIEQIQRGLPNVWLGVSVENQHFADERIPLLLQTPAVVRFISAEPLLGPVALEWHLYDGCHKPGVHPIPECDEDSPGLDWVIVGGESGPGARPFDLAWPRAILDQCRAAGVAFFMKQAGDNAGYTGTRNMAAGQWVPLRLKKRKGGELLELPGDLRVRQFPAVPA